MQEPSQTNLTDISKSVSIREVENGYVVSIDGIGWKTFVYTTLDEAIGQVKSYLTK